MSRRGNGCPDYPDTLAYASDAESYAASLYTSPDFGCVQWQEHPARLAKE